MYKPQLLTLILNYKCQYGCDHCNFFGGPKNIQEMPKEEAINYILLGRKKGIKSVLFSGGEPFMHPSFPELMDLAHRLDLGVEVTGAYIGGNDHQMRENAQSLAGCGACYMTSMNQYQASAVISESNYLERKIAEFRALIDAGVSTGITMIDGGDTDWNDNFLKRFMSSLDLIAMQRSHPSFRSQFSLVPIQGGQHIGVGFQPLMRVGKAYAKKLEPDPDYVEAIAKQKGELFCAAVPADPNYAPDLDILMVHPDGLVNICCQPQKGANFGFGNLRIDGWDKVISNIRQHPLIQSTSFERNLNRIRVWIEKNQPDTVPIGGFLTGCEVCNLYFSNGWLRSEANTDLGLEELV
jgi:hypothetical protein